MNNLEQLESCNLKGICPLHFQDKLQKKFPASWISGKISLDSREYFVVQSILWAEIIGSMYQAFF